MKPHVVIVGAGFGGLYAARALIDAPVDVTVVDKQNYHLFQPLLYQVATAGLSPGDIAAPIRHVLRRGANIEVLMGEVTRVDLNKREVQLNDRALQYDYLMLATGVRHAYFGRPEWEPLAPGLKTLDDALEIRRRVLLAFEAAEAERDETVRRGLLTFAIIGAGPTGVELAGAIAELARVTVARDFRHIDTREAKIVLLEAGPRVLSTFDPSLSARAAESLARLGVEVRTSTRVLDVTPQGLKLESGLLPSRTVLWAAGVAAGPLSQTLGVELDRAGRVVVQGDLSIAGFPHVFVLGDLASFTESDNSTLPGLCPVAMQQGEYAARRILADIEKRPHKSFKYVDKGTMATIGRAAGIAQIGSLKFSGFVGWLFWLFVHLLFLIGFRNRLLVMVEWAYAFFTFQRGARLITGTSSNPAPRATDIGA